MSKQKEVIDRTGICTDAHIERQTDRKTDRQTDIPDVTVTRDIGFPERSYMITKTISITATSNKLHQILTVPTFQLLSTS